MNSDLPPGTRLADRVSQAVYLFATTGLAVAILGSAALVTGEPFLIPPLGASAFLVFFAPSNAFSSPRNLVLGHLFALVAGYVALVVTGLTDAPPTMSGEFTADRVLATVLALGATSVLMALAKAPHPPAGATTLIVSFGLVTRPAHLAAVEVGVAALAAFALVVHRLRGVRYPVWSTSTGSLPYPAPVPPPADAAR